MNDELRGLLALVTLHGLILVCYAAAVARLSARDDTSALPPIARLLADMFPSGRHAVLDLAVIAVTQGFVLFLIWILQATTIVSLFAFVELGLAAAWLVYVRKSRVSTSRFPIVKR